MPASATETIEAICRSYLEAWARKDISGIEAALHPNVQFKAPMQELHGREAVVAATARMLPRLIAFDHVEQFIAGDCAMFTYDFVCIDPIGLCRTAERVRIVDGLVRDIELFFDARPFEAMQKAMAAAQRT